MYAVCLTGGKQYKVAEGDVIKVERLDNVVGDKVKLDVLMVNGKTGIKVGSPLVDKAFVEAEVTYVGKGEKINIFKYKAKKNVRKRKGHRQPFTELKVLKIKG